MATFKAILRAPTVIPMADQRAATIRILLALVDADPTVLGGTLIKPDGSVTYLDAAQPRWGEHERPCFQARHGQVLPNSSVRVHGDQGAIADQHRPRTHYAHTYTRRTTRRCVEFRHFPVLEEVGGTAYLALLVTSDPSVRWTPTGMMLWVVEQ